ncbi:TetR/AcrR family transcriptional regulator [Mycobacterium crocinum]|uniref:TetR/AcrR family transcriptional regulator n=1 Tax=Mycolicibacterium crocinum TaxID=388459 RepID=A0ABY3TEK2_9MYCO|nr:TetR/AcrR family transcriptional regulator [Mycolicibacterium crocinum]MCV7214383.1 TetR/AcrR family transcriptional regulator [Mycolicibacterium crocinum]ULN39882.1 TetR/AcrR family transcriptional regulator [Mycolicibacterium crocinum]
MLSISNDESVGIGDRIMAAAASCVRDFGVERVTLAEIARRAGVSRPTVYRRWPDTRTIVASLLTERITGTWRAVPATQPGRTGLVERIVEVARRLRDDELITSVLRSAPDLAMTYIAGRLGTSQQILIDLLVDALRDAQADGSVRAGDVRQLSAMVLLIGQSAIQSAQIVEPILDADALSVELSHALNGYLAP